MRIATWNINGLQARFDFLIHWLRARRPDIVALQELKLADEKFPHEDLAAEGYSALSHGQKTWNGVAILSSKPMKPSQLGLPGQEHLGARLIGASAGGTSVVSVYCPNGRHVDDKEFGRKLAWLDGLATYLEQDGSAADPFILCGDFNICPSGLDSWNEDRFQGQIFHTEAERSRFRWLLDWGLIDAYRLHHPNKQAFSWWDYRAGAFHKNQGLRIDFLLMTRALANRIERIEIDRDYRKKKEGMTASDHAPVIADLD